jgi:hypothetical protein
VLRRLDRTAQHEKPAGVVLGLLGRGEGEASRGVLPLLLLLRRRRRRRHRARRHAVPRRWVRAPASPAQLPQQTREPALLLLLLLMMMMMMMTMMRLSPRRCLDSEHGSSPLLGDAQLPHKKKERHAGIDRAIGGSAAPQLVQSARPGEKHPAEPMFCVYNPKMSAIACARRY